MVIFLKTCYLHSERSGGDVGGRAVVVATVGPGDGGVISGFKGSTHSRISYRSKINNILYSVR